MIPSCSARLASLDIHLSNLDAHLRGRKAVAKMGHPILAGDDLR